MNETLKKRIKSFLWRLGALVLVAVLGFILDILPELGLPEVVAGVIVLVIGECTKYLNKRHQLKVAIK